MQYQINAWLEKDNPALKIIDSVKQQVIKEFQGDELESLIEQGDIVPDELLSTNQILLDSVVDELLFGHPQVAKNERLAKQAKKDSLKNLQRLVEKAKRF